MGGIFLQSDCSRSDNQRFGAEHIGKADADRIAPDVGADHHAEGLVGGLAAGQRETDRIGLRKEHFGAEVADRDDGRRGRLCKYALLRRRPGGGPGLAVLGLRIDGTETAQEQGRAEAQTPECPNTTGWRNIEVSHHHVSLVEFCNMRRSLPNLPVAAVGSVRGNVRHVLGSPAGFDGVNASRAQTGARCVHRA